VVILLLSHDNLIVEEKIMAREVLVLNSDYEPLNICHLHRAIKLVYKDKADILHYLGEEDSNVECVYDASGIDHPVPLVIRLRFQIKRPRIIARVSRRGIYARDNYKCQYCGSPSDLTLDHVVPKRLGGKDTWENLVTCCKKCNSRKSDKPLDKSGLILNKIPKAPIYNTSLGFKYIYGASNSVWRWYLPSDEEAIVW
jgi:5-methylcytosine-specific restriction endonuclease McrA